MYPGEKVMRQSGSQPSYWYVSISERIISATAAGSMIVRNGIWDRKLSHKLRSS